MKCLRAIIKSTCISAFQKHIRNCSSQTGATLASAGKLEPMIDLSENPRELLEKDGLKLLLSHYGFSVRDAIVRTDTELHDVIKRFDDICYHTAPERELIICVKLLHTYKGFESPKNLTPSNIKMAVMLGWAFEYLTTTSFLTDDILDKNTMRWKKPCWHTLPHVGLTGLCDARTVSMAGFALLRKYLRCHPFYHQLSTLLVNFQYDIYLGQSFDYVSASMFKKSRDASLLSMDHYFTTVWYKTSSPAYYIPIVAAAYLANLDPQICSVSRDVFRTVGIHRQAQNDMWDACGYFDNSGKTSTDFTAGVCTWITATIMEHGSEEQKNVLLQNYGRTEPECHEKIYQLMRELDILERYRSYTQKVIKECQEHTKIAHPGITRILNLIVKEHIDVKESFNL
ncbi:farnesyl pyrophosphate synthase-like [Photinus pyralis]|uniref:Terpene synthase n=1 Tax=Photinus pyralis TaxID=7054 RepID=A0A1Y1N275_PHOPY|nr:farnesyl pyrophosphate synthase-like [Photinus pyralis]